MYLDVLVLNENSGQAVALTRDGGLRFAVQPAMTAMNSQETLALSSFLARNAWNLQCAAGLVRFASVVAVWRPAAFRMLQEAHYQQLLQHPDQLVHVGRVDQQSAYYYYAGFTADLQEVVLVPGSCYYDRFRAALARRVGEELQSDDIWDIAMTIEAGLEIDPDDDAPWPLLGQAHAWAREVAYWRREAGTVPLAGDIRDARLPRYFRPRGASHGQE